MSTVGDRILWILAQRRIGQRELARRAGLRGAHIGVIINRSRKNPAASIENPTLAAIARGGGVSLRWLATGQGSPDPAPDEREARAILATCRVGARPRTTSGRSFRRLPSGSSNARAISPASAHPPRRMSNW